ncbi:MAG: cytochrome-c peroxidase [endosymbiont of Galathealinum brachiosum]|uniref:Methylamine utilization protein MauG n=1 Tax=endosymbiont of Galathealinum brachiosum TaxID=2200906 RepID=A0A370DJ69_9GAMM|nr:MAG: cytochrome-c peroxidase [endosymbiont of Galathealinum brachiosum]
MKHLTPLLLVSLISFQAQATDWKALPDSAPAPADNPTTAEKVELGKMLFMDPRFSSTGTVSCNSCHNVMEGGDDSRSVSMGVHGKTGGRNAPTVWNSAFHSVQFWDGRAPLLEDQAKGPVANPIEMGMKDVETAMERVKTIPGYKTVFDKAFGKDSMTVENAAKAVAAFERTLITPNSPYDKYVKGNKTAMNKQQVQGMNKFAEAGCTSCHSGAAFNGPEQKLGEGFYVMFPTFDNKYVSKYKLDEDKGREEATGKATDRGMFRIPTLRNITDTAPYFHNGSVNDLAEAVRVMAKTQLNSTLAEKDVNDIVAFLGALTGEYPEITMPRLPATSGTSIIAD